MWHLSLKQGDGERLRNDSNGTRQSSAAVHGFARYENISSPAEQGLPCPVHPPRFCRSDHRLPTTQVWSMQTGSTETRKPECRVNRLLLPLLLLLDSDCIPDSSESMSNSARVNERRPTTASPVDTTKVSYLLAGAPGQDMIGRRKPLCIPCHRDGTLRLTQQHLSIKSPPRVAHVASELEARQWGKTSE